MKRGIRKAIAFGMAAAMMAVSALPGMAADSGKTITSKVLLENTYDAEVSWDNGALFIKNGSIDSITDQTEMKLVKPDGSIIDFSNKNKFDKIYATLSGADYTCKSNYLIVGKDGKKALLKEDGSFVNDTTYDDIVTASDKYMVVKDGEKFVVQKLDSTLVKAYSSVSDIHLYETEHGLVVTDGTNVIGLFDANQNEIDLSDYDMATYTTGLKNYIQVTFANAVGYINDTGKVIVPPEYTYINPHLYNGALYFDAFGTANKKTYFRLFNADGTVLFEALYGGGVDGYCIYMNSDHKYGIYDFVNKTNKVEPIYDAIYTCNDQYFVCSQNGKTAVKTYDGKVVFESDKYNTSNLVVMISKNYLVINVVTDNTINNLKCTSDVYSIDGKLLFSSEKYDYITLYNEEILGTRVLEQTNISVNLLDEKGKDVFSSRNYNTYALCTLVNGHLWIAAKDGKVGMIDDYNNAVVDLNYQSLGDFSSNDQTYSNLFLFSSNDNQNYYICTKQNDKFGLIKISSIISTTGLSLDKTDTTLKVGDTTTLTPQFAPADATNQKVTWASSDDSVATVKDGVVTALKPGTATITATSEDGGLKATCTVTVTDADSPTTTTSNSTDTTGSADQGGMNTNPVSQEIKSPSTGESPVACASVFLVIASAAVVGLSFKKKF